MLLGYYNRNTRETLDIPIGPNNHIGAGSGTDQGQPTFFETGRQWGVFVVKVPKDFGTKAVTWTIVSNGEKQSIPFTLNKGYPIAPYKVNGMGNQPPTLAFSPGGPKFTGPPTAVASSYTGAVNQPVEISVWADDPKGTDPGGPRRPWPGHRLQKSVHRTSSEGLGRVTFETRAKSWCVQTRRDRTVAKATFSAPGEYLLRVQANDESGEGGGGFQCCWTNTYVKVSVK